MADVKLRSIFQGLLFYATEVPFLLLQAAYQLYLTTKALPNSSLHRRLQYPNNLA